MNEYCNWDRKTTKTADFNFCYVHFRLMPLREAWIHIFSCQLYRKSRGRLDSLDSNHYQEKNTSELRIEKRLSGWNFRIRNGLQRELVWFEPVNIMTNVKKKTWIVGMKIFWTFAMKIRRSETGMWGCISGKEDAAGLVSMSRRRRTSSSSRGMRPSCSSISSSKSRWGR